MAVVSTTERLLRLLQLASPSLPVGAYAYSQGLEWAVEAGWVSDPGTLKQWLEVLVAGTLAQVDIPILIRLHHACSRDDSEAMEHWSGLLVATRETAELRAEEHQRGRAMATLLAGLGVAPAGHWRSYLERCQVAGFTYAAVAWGISLHETALGYAWAWLEGQVLAAVKLIPLGQTDGQRVLQGLLSRLGAAVETGLAVADEDIGASNPALAIASSLHETQYTRLFRS